MQTNMILAAFKVFVCIICLEVISIKSYNVAERTAKGESLFNPIRIHVHFQQFDDSLSEREILTIKESVSIVTTYLKHLLSVVSLNEPLLLKRSACARSWLDGPNKGKCAFKRRDYNGEYCKGGFKIPDDHLEGFVVWMYNESEPRTWFRMGSGVRKADYILYIQAITTKECVMANYKPDMKSLIAYTAECKLGKYGLQVDNNDRPLASYINFCPSKLKDSGKNRENFIVIIIHEVLHGLGFSKYYFDNFKDCSGVSAGSVCPPQRFPLYRKIKNDVRILTTNVMQQMQNHFLCYESDFGGPLEMKSDKYRKDSFEIQSHWDAKQMYSSIMSPSSGLPELTFVDPVSLAFLEDSGWYKVNYSMADDYPWGKNKGCTFGNRLAELDDTTCSLRGVRVSSGCNVFHTHKILCSDSSVLENEVKDENRCAAADSLWNDEFITQETDTLFNRCLLSNFSNSDFTGKFQTDLKGQCFKILCQDSDGVQVILNETVSIPCPDGQIIDLTNFDLDLKMRGIIVCPKETELICFRRKKPLYFQIQMQDSTTTAITNAIENVTILPKYVNATSPLSQNAISTERQNLTSKGNCIVIYEKLIPKAFYLTIVCLIVLQFKNIDLLVFCMF